MVALATNEVLKRLTDAWHATHGPDEVTPTASALEASGSHVTSATPEPSGKQQG